MEDRTYSFIPQVAEMLGVKLHEVFKVGEPCGSVASYYLDDSRLVEVAPSGVTRRRDDILRGVLCGINPIKISSWKPKLDEKYYFPNVRTKSVDCMRWKEDITDLALCALGMCYRYKSEAEKHFEEDFNKLTGRNEECH